MRSGSALRAGAEVTGNGGRSWNQLPSSGVSTYTPGGTGPSLMYNPATKTVNFQATGANNQNVNATMQAGTTGVSFTDIQGQQRNQRSRPASLGLR